MDDKLQNFFTENEFDVHQPHSGHFKRFEKKLKSEKPQRSMSWKWMSVAAAVILSIGFGLGNLTQESNSYDLSSISPKMGETQNFLVNAIHVEMIELEKNRTLDTESIIETTLEELEELEDTYKAYVKKLKRDGEQREIINAMISNYQQRLEILKRALKQIDNLRINNNLENEDLI